MNAQQQAILEAFDAARAASPRLPAISIAERLSISEGELQAARLGRDVTTLGLAPAELAAELYRLGRVKALTRSSAAVLEQQGHYPPLSSAGLLLDPGGLDLRLQLQRWHWACLIRDPLPDANGGISLRHSLQVFDCHGQALHKAFSLEATPPRIWQRLAARGNHHAPVFTRLALPAARPLPQAPGLEQDWSRMRDVHQFFALLRRHGLQRHEANTLMEGRFTRRLACDSVERTLNDAAVQQLPLMLFVASPGAVQIRTGVLPAPLRQRGWLNLFGDDFTLHLDDGRIERVWQVHKPNRDGGVTSLEAFSCDGELLLQLYAERGEGSAEQQAWRDLLAQQAGLEAAA
ncbi:putative hemin transport protein [Franzmannia pantelleriensis]|uniref:Putative hemin transport protein n=1 Tax=Franzmannia pantelleriensis TaxID=48727 RepID=A0A1G9GXP7_9GAMM|nr:ChuX/HutX family heme-like substrate-binding protein [Halomonas pantelleriensis]SDL05043.1 putative hemin transport protein [Halomonas pantelleriensis]